MNNSESEEQERWITRNIKKLLARFNDCSEQEVIIKEDIIILAPVAAGIIVLIVFLLMFIKINFVPNYTTEAIVKSVGGKGITVLYSDEYGENTKSANVDVNSISEYNVGDTIIIDVYDTRVEVAGRC